MSDISRDKIATAGTHVLDNTRKSKLTDIETSAGNVLYKEAPSSAKNVLCKTMPNFAKITLCKTAPSYAKILLCRLTPKPIVVTFTAALRDHLQRVTSNVYDYNFVTVKAQKTRTISEEAVDSSQSIAQSSKDAQFTTSTAQRSHVRQITVAMYDCTAATDVELLDTAKGNL